MVLGATSIRPSLRHQTILPQTSRHPLDLHLQVIRESIFVDHAEGVITSIEMETKRM